MIGAMAVGIDGMIYITDVAMPTRHVWVIDHGCAYKREFGAYGTGIGQFRIPNGIAVDPEGCIYIGDSGNSKILKYDSKGAFVTEWSTGVDRVAVGATGIVYVVRVPAGRVDRFNYLWESGKAAAVSRGDWQYTIRQGIVDNVARITATPIDLVGQRGSSVTKELVVDPQSIPAAGISYRWNDARLTVDFEVPPPVRYAVTAKREQMEDPVGAEWRDAAATVQDTGEQVDSPYLTLHAYNPASSPYIATHLPVTVSRLTTLKEQVVDFRDQAAGADYVNRTGTLFRVDDGHWGVVAESDANVLRNKVDTHVSLGGTYPTWQNYHADYELAVESMDPGDRVDFVLKDNAAEGLGVGLEKTTAGMRAVCYRTNVGRTVLSSSDLPSWENNRYYVLGLDVRYDEESGLTTVRATRDGALMTDAKYPLARYGGITMTVDGATVRWKRLAVQPVN
jgi:hypothetical protein